MINDEKEVSALRKQIIGLTACLAGLCFSGCRDVVLSTSLNDHILFSGTKTRLSLEECSLVFLDFQTRYNLYYENLGETDFWKEKAGESDFSDYLRWQNKRRTVHVSAFKRYGIRAWCNTYR